MWPLRVSVFDTPHVGIEPFTESTDRGVEERVRWIIPIISFVVRLDGLDEQRTDVFSEQSRCDTP